MKNAPSWKRGSTPQHTLSSSSSWSLFGSSQWLVGTVMTVGDAFTKVTPSFCLGTACGWTIATSLLSLSTGAATDERGALESEAESGRPELAGFGWACRVVLSKLISCFMSLWLLQPNIMHNHVLFLHGSETHKDESSNMEKGRISPLFYSPDASSSMYSQRG